MGLLMDGLLTAGSLFAGCYCWVLARRVRDLKSLDKGLGGSIVKLTRQIELARSTLEEARAASKDNRDELAKLISRADAAAGQLKLLLATVRHSEPVQAPPRRPEPESVRHEPVGETGPVRRPEPEPVRRKPSAASLALRPEAAEQATAERPADTHLPKPRPLSAFEGNPLRLFRPATVPSDEDELIDALASIAGGGH